MNYMDGLEWFLNQDIRLPMVTLSIDFAVLKSVSLLRARATLQRLTARQRAPLGQHSEGIVEYAKKIDLERSISGDDTVLPGLCAVVDELSLYHDSPWLVALPRCQKLRKLSIKCEGSFRIMSRDRDVWVSLLPCRHHLDSLSIEAFRPEEHSSTFVSKLIHGNDRLVRIIFRSKSNQWPFEVSRIWVPTEVRNTLRRNRRRRMKHFVAECNLLPPEYNDELSVGTSLLYLMIHANCHRLGQGS